MKSEIDRDHFCSTAGMTDCPEKGDCKGCPDCHRKYPTPSQYREEYGEEYADHRPVWWKYADNNGVWRTKSYRAAMGVQERLRREGGLYPNILIVCACTPWDRPSASWQPSNGSLAHVGEFEIYQPSNKGA